MAKGTKGIQRLSVPSSFPYGKTKVDTIASVGDGGGTLYGPLASGKPPINAARDRGQARSKLPRVSKGRR